jgi:hypothetical protein
VQSSTTPLFVLLLAVISPVWGNLPYLANLIGVMSLAAGGLLLWELAATWKAPWAGCAGLLLYPTFPLAVKTLGSETPLYIAFCLGAIVVYVRRRYRVTSICTALAVLTRPDGLLLAMILTADFAMRYFREKGKILRFSLPARWKFVKSSISDDALSQSRSSTSIPWYAIFLFLGFALPWFIFAWVYFGSPFPVTLAAKQQQGAMVVSQRFAQGFLTTIGWYKTWRYELEAGLALLGLVFITFRARRWLLFLAWPVLYFIAYSILGVSRYFWYYTPLVPGFLAASGVGLQAIAGSPVFSTRLNELISAMKGQRWMARLQPAQILSLVFLAVLCLGQIGSVSRLRQPDTRYIIYRAAGEWLANYTTVDSTVGALEVGILGYYARRPMIDFAGLIQPVVAAQLTGGSGYEYTALWAVDHFKPRYLVLLLGDFTQLVQGYVSRRCSLRVSFTGETLSYEKDLAVYECR